jgi:small subunit ribosomal protein S17
MVKEKLSKAGKKEKTTVGTRGRTFKGYVTKVFSNRIVIEFEKTVYVPKYERYYKKKTKLHARLPEQLVVEIGDYVKIQECRPLSKIIHCVALEKIKSKEDKAE